MKLKKIKGVIVRLYTKTDFFDCLDAKDKTRKNRIRRVLARFNYEPAIDGKYYKEDEFNQILSKLEVYFELQERKIKEAN